MEGHVLLWQAAWQTKTVLWEGKTPRNTNRCLCLKPGSQCAPIRAHAHGHAPIRSCALYSTQ